jgi:hypothetical protein
MKTVKIKHKNGSIEHMEIEEYSRWACLIEAMGFIEQRAREMNVSMENIVKPLALDEYIQRRFPAMVHDVSCELEIGNI